MLFLPYTGRAPISGERALLLGDPHDALDRSVMISDERRAYLAKRWSYWQQHERQKNADPSSVRFRQVGVE